MLGRPDRGGSAGQKQVADGPLVAMLLAPNRLEIGREQKRLQRHILLFGIAGAATGHREVSAFEAKWNDMSRVLALGGCSPAFRPFVRIGMPQ
ncbi:hypothetical protein DOI34_24510 [Salmonella enterica subsp. enterica serovar Virchow]|nr:hypothetical protein [Salmonella enterica subsp. enterica serovar Virchow]